MRKVEYEIYCAKQHIQVAKESIENGVEDLIDYSIGAAEKCLKKAEKYLEEEE